MAQQVGYDGLLSYAVQSISFALARLAGNRSRQVQAIADALAAGDARRVAAGLTVRAFPNVPDDSVLEKLRDALSEVARAVGAARGDRVSAPALSRLAERLLGAGELLVELDAAPMAYNLFECSYQLSTLIPESALKAAKLLRKYSNPTKVDQFASAIWYFATAQLRHSLASGGEWLQAIDAVELALTAVPDSPALQKQVYTGLETVLREARNTPIEDLVAIVPVQAPPSAIPTEYRDRFIRALLNMRFPRASGGGTSAPELNGGARFMAAVTAQVMVDDLRLRLAGTSGVRASLTWLDRTLRHQNLSSAVPLGQALVADVDRTGVFAMELVHEIGHAYALLGPIGWASAALRVSVQWLEFLLHVASREASEPEAVILPDWLPDDLDMVLLAERQIANAYRAAVTRATWTPWLEGVSVYLELLCDPADDPQEISSVHEAVRSLVDCRPSPAGDVDSDTVGEELAANFETFYSRALGQNSRLRHKAYTTDENSATYLSGYLLVRSIVSRWEATLGRRIVPAFAVKLLLSATRNGTSDAVMGLDEPLLDFHEQCRKRFLRWSENLARLDRQALEEFFVSVGKDEHGRRYLWQDGRPFLATPDTSPAIPGAYNEVLKAAIRLTWPSGDVADGPSWEKVDATGVFASKIESMVDDACALAALLPVGKDYARALLSDETGRLAVFPRTYVGVEKADDDLALPRYSISSWVLPNGATDVRHLRQLLVVQGESRLLATRVIDLGGSLERFGGRPNISYVCFYLPGTDWIHISVGYLAPNIANDEEELRNRIIQRITPPDFLHDEADTIGSLQFLVRRLHDTGIPSSLASFAGEFDERLAAEQTAFTALASAFGGNPDQIAEAIREALGNKVASLDIANYLFESGFGRNPAQAPGSSATLLSDFAFDTATVSGVIPHQGSLP